MQIVRHFFAELKGAESTQHRAFEATTRGKRHQ